MPTLRGLLGRPYLDLTPYLDTAPLLALDEEICLALATCGLPVVYTGGSHRSMGIMPPSLRGEPFIDYGEVIRGFTPAEFATFLSLADERAEFDLTRPGDYSFGEERDHPLSFRQMRYLETRYGVYFPWKVFYELMPTRSWADKSSPGKDFTRDALRHFPRTVAYVRGLPFQRIGRCNILGLAANDHGTVHRDGEPEDQTAPDHFITICPRGNKRLFLWDEAERTRTYVHGRAYWFNDFDYHGVDADPFFRYSLRVDGVFSPDFLRRLEQDHGMMLANHRDIP